MPGWAATRRWSGRRCWQAWVVFLSIFGCCGASFICKRRRNVMDTGATPKTGLSVRHLPPNIFAMVMATGIVSLALVGAGHRMMALLLFWLNVGLFTILSALLVARVVRWRSNLAADLKNHAKAPGFFTLVAG